MAVNEETEESSPKEPEAPLPDADDWTEPQEETERSLSGRFAKSYIAAAVLSGIALWQFIHVSNGGEPLIRLHARTEKAPVKTRSERLMRLRMEARSVDPVAAYVARSKRGMTDQEIRWMIGDFQAAGLDRPSHDANGERRAREREWYLRAMTEALHLTAGQKAQAKAKMAALLAEDVKAFEKGMAGVGANPAPDTVAIGSYASTAVWLFKDAYAPWNLCDLTPEQDKLTMHHWRETMRQHRSGAAPSSQAWTGLPKTRLDPASGNLVEMGADDPFTFGGPEGHALSGRIIVLDSFPLTPDQLAGRAGVSGLDQARGLQAPQLRVAMLIEPDAAKRLLAQLDLPVVPQASDFPASIPDSQ